MKYFTTLFSENFIKLFLWNFHEIFMMIFSSFFQYFFFIEKNEKNTLDEGRLAGIISTPIVWQRPQKNAKMCTFFPFKKHFFFRAAFFQSFLAQFFIMNGGYPPQRGSKRLSTGPFSEKCAGSADTCALYKDPLVARFFFFFLKKKSAPEITFSKMVKNHYFSSFFHVLKKW